MSNTSGRKIHYADLNIPVYWVGWGVETSEGQISSDTYNPLSTFTIIISLPNVSTHCVINYFKQ